MVMLATSSLSIVPCAVDDGKGRRDEPRRIVLMTSGAASRGSGLDRERIASDPCIRRPPGLR
jgi:hypothetical protein